MFESLRHMTLGEVMDSVERSAKLISWDSKPTPGQEPFKSAPRDMDTSIQGRRFALARTIDESGVSGTGYVATGIVFADGHVALRWNTKTASTGVYSTINEVLSIHGHGGATHIEWID